MPNESYIAVNKATVAGGSKVATYEFVNTGGATVESEAVTLTTGTGDEQIGAKPSAESIPVVLATDQAPIEVKITSQTSTLNNGVETPVTSASAVQILAANPSRLQAIIQNTGTGNIRIGVAGVTATTGRRSRSRSRPTKIRDRDRIASPVIDDGSMLATSTQKQRAPKPPPLAPKLSRSDSKSKDRSFRLVGLRSAAGSRSSRSRSAGLTDRRDVAADDDRR